MRNNRIPPQSNKFLAFKPRIVLNLFSHFQKINASIRHLIGIVAILLFGNVVFTAAAVGEPFTVKDLALLSKSSLCLRYNAPSVESLRNSNKKVFAHYFSPYPLSLDNKPVADDYYTVNFLNPHGENEKWISVGGLWRDRPLPTPDYPHGTDWKVENMKLEVKRAIAIGLDGFTFDVIKVESSEPYFKNLLHLLDAAQAVDPDFLIQLMPDVVTSEFNGSRAKTTANLKILLDAVGAHPSIQKLEDGSVILTPFDATAKNAPYWNAVLDALKESGYKVAFMPLALGSVKNNWKFKHVPKFGMANWGSRTIVSAAASIIDDTGYAASHDALWMCPVAPQESVPRHLRFSETNNSAAFRAQWDAVIKSDADWVQLTTWNDYSENTHISPSVHTGAGFYALAKYYIEWFKTGVEPTIQQDTLFYFHRAHTLDDTVAVPTSAQRRPFRPEIPNPVAAVNEIELVALLTAPGKMEIIIDGNTHEQDVQAGLQVFTIPHEEGTPTFRLIRDGKTVIELQSRTPINNSIDYQDPLYHAGSISNCDVTDPGLIPQTSWTLLSVDSEELLKDDAAAVNAFDGNEATIWHTQYAGSSPPHPHSIEINLGGRYTIDGFIYLPRQDGGVNGRIADYEFSVSMDGVNWMQVATGAFLNDATAKEERFTLVEGRFVRLSALSEVNGNPWTSVAELNVLGTVISEPIPQASWTLLSVDSEELLKDDAAAVNAFDGNEATIWHTQYAGSSPPHPHSIEINLGGRYTIDGFIYLPRQDGGVNGRIADYEFSVSMDGVNWMQVATGAFLNDASAKKENFTPVEGRFVRLRALSEVNGNPWTSVAELNVLGTVISEPIPQASWTLLSVDSEELLKDDAAAVNAFDGNEATIWHTQYAGSSPPHPHSIEINLGGRYTIDGFIYLPRQDGGVNGRIADYEFSVSMDGVNWMQVATGAFLNDATAKEERFTLVEGRFVRLRALSEVNGNPWTSVAEIQILGR